MDFDFQEEDKATELFMRAKEKYGLFPVTVWDINYSDPLTRDLKKQIGDGETSFTREGTETLGYKSARKECFTKAADNESCYAGKITESIFSPQIAQYIFSMFAPKTGLCFDPFGGGGTRAIIASKNGMSYLGNEIRQEEVDAVNIRLKNNRITNAKLICQDSQNCAGIESNIADFSITCPPYYDMEKYNGPDGDLSMFSTYEEFISGMKKVAKETFRIMKDNTYVTIVIGLHRDKNKNLLPMHHDFARIYREVGFNYKEEIILAHRNNGAIQRVGNFEKGSHILIRTHEYLLVFKKGMI
jgi:DNA modification methylase